VALVLLRLALHWPLKGVVDVVLPHGKHPAWLPPGGDPILWLVSAWVLIVLGIGLAELLQRVSMAKFATHTVHDLRAAAVRGAARARGAEPPGELVARIIGDTARVKESLKGILIHVSQNGLLYLGVSLVFVFLSPQLSLFLLAGGLAATLIGFQASTRVATVFRKQRKKEGAYATAIHEGLAWDVRELDRLNRTSAAKDVRVTKLITLSSLLVHGVFGATTGLGVWVGARQLQAGRLSPGDLVLFITYALMVHPRVIQVGRQLARGGKVLACVDRIGSLIGEAALAPAAVPAPRPLATALRLEGVTLRPKRLRELDLAIRAGSRVAVLGPPGSGKSSLLRLVAGLERADRGRVLWDDEDLGALPEALLARVGFLAQDPVFPPRRLWRLLGLPGPEGLSADALGTLERIGVGKIVRRRGLDGEAGSATLSRGEARLVRLGAVLLGAAPVWVLDAPVEGLGARRSRRCLDEVFARLGGRTLVVSLARPVSLERFDRVIALRKGRIAFDAGPQEWKGRRLLRQ
jgi:ATP-binding cassette subfamily B protein